MWRLRGRSSGESKEQENEYTSGTRMHHDTNLQNVQKKICLFASRSHTGRSAESRGGGAIENLSVLRGAPGQQPQRLNTRLQASILKSYRPKCKDSMKKRQKSVWRFSLSQGAIRASVEEAGKDDSPLMRQVIVDKCVLALLGAVALPIELTILSSYHRPCGRRLDPMDRSFGSIL